MRRTATECGVVRTFTALVLSWDTDACNANGTNALGVFTRGLVRPALARRTTGDRGTVAAGKLAAHYMFAQFAGVTLPKKNSALNERPLLAQSGRLLIQIP
jgi:hypothetical protein